MSLTDLQQIVATLGVGTPIGAVVALLLYVFIKPLVVPVSVMDRQIASYKAQIEDLKKENDTLRLVASQATINAENSLRTATDLVQRIRSGA